MTDIATVLTPVAEARRAWLTVARDVADATVALRVASLPLPVRTYLVAIIDRADEDAARGVSVKTAAAELGVSQPTVRSWLERGVLEAVPGKGTTSVTPRSLGEALAAVRTIRHAEEGDGRLLRDVLDYLDDLRARRDIEDRIATLEDRVVVDPAGLPEILYGEPSASS